MAFTRDFEITHPAGSENISQGDDRIRNLKSDLEERLEDMFCGFNADDGTGDEATYGAKKLVFKEQASIATPSANQITVAAKEADSKAELHVKDEDGDEFQITTGGKLGGCDVQLTAGKDLIGSATSDIKINTNKFTVAGATGNTSVGGTFESVGVATLADASVTKTTAAPGADAQIANKKYVDDKMATEVTARSFGTWTDKDSGGSVALAKDEVYKVGSDGFVSAFSTADAWLEGYTDSGSATTKRIGCIVAASPRTGIVFMPVKKDDYWKVTAQSGTPKIYWLPTGSGTSVKQ